MSITLRHPLPGSRPTDPFGPRGHVPGLGDLGFHNGQDYAAAAGTKIRAAASGTVISSWFDNLGGWQVQLRHAGGYRTQYAHMRVQSPLPVGATVRAGDTVGEVGETGSANGPHLHFMLFTPGGQLVNPVPHIGAAASTSATPTGRNPLMYMICTDAYKTDKARPGRRWAVVGSGFFHEIYSQEEANSVNKALGGGSAAIVDGPAYRAHRASAQAGMR